MSIIYVNDDGNDSDGSSWANAYQTLDTAFGAWTTSDVIWVGHDHRETWAASHSFTSSANDAQAIPIPIYRVNTGSDLYDISDATINFETTTANDNLQFNNNIRAYGLKIKPYNDLNISNNGEEQHFIDCDIDFVSGGSLLSVGTSGGDASFYMKGGTLDFLSTGQIHNNGGAIIFDDVIFAGTPVAAGLIQLVRSGKTDFKGCDLTAYSTDTLVDASASGDTQGEVRFISGSLPASINITDGAFASAGLRAHVIATDADGASDAKRYSNELHTLWGTVKDNITTYLDASTGHEDGTTKYSFEMTSGNNGTTNVKPWAPLEGIELQAYISSTGSKTFTVEAVENFTSALNIDEAWMEVYYLGTANSTKYEVGTTKSHLLTTALTAGTGLANWTGEPGGSRSVKFAKTVTVNEPGVYAVKIFLGTYESGKVLHYDSGVTVS